MDMKKILQVLDEASTKPVEGSNDMKKFLSVVTEGANPHKVALPVQMAMQHYAQPQVEQPKTIKEVKKSEMSSMLYQYYTVAEQELVKAEESKKELISEQARQIAQRILDKDKRLDELSKETLQSYKNKAEDQVKELEPHSLEGEYKDLAKNAIERRKKGIEKADKKIAAKESQDPAEYDQEGEMARQDLSTAEEAAEELRSILSSNENLPEWVQAKITKAVDYLDTARDYMKSVDESRYGHRDAYQRDYDSSVDFGHRNKEWDEGDKEPPNNFAIYINGKKWKVLAGNGTYADDHRERQQHLRLQNLCAKKTAESGKKWTVHATGEAPTNESVSEAKKKTLKNSNPCWKGYHPVGTKEKGGRTVPNCVPKE